MASHSPLIRLNNAKLEWYRAQERCSHWDYESNGAGHYCCDELEDAERELRLARRAVKEQP